MVTKVRRVIYTSKVANLRTFVPTLIYIHIHTYIRAETDIRIHRISFEIYYPDSDPEPFRIVANYFKQFEIDFELLILFIATENV